MTDDFGFRVLLGVGSLVLLPIAARHRLRARTGERLDRRQEGLVPAILLRLSGLAHLLSVLAFIANPELLAWAAVPLPAGLRWAGAAPGLAACLVIAWALRHLGKNLTDTVVTRARHSLVTTGPYRWIRHPFYLGVGLAILGNSLVTANLLAFATGSLAFALLALRTGREEANLLARFGEDYRRYRRETGRFVPRLGLGWVPPSRGVRAP